MRQNSTKLNRLQKKVSSITYEKWLMALVEHYGVATALHSYFKRKGRRGTATISEKSGT